MTNKKIKQIYEVYRKDDAYEIFSFYNKDKYLSGKSLEEITDFLNRIQKEVSAGHCYGELTGVKERKGNLIYEFKDIPGHKSIAMEQNLPPSYTFYKIVPKLKLNAEEGK